MLSRLTRFLLRLFGWRLEGTLPDTPKYVIIAAPHTSNWDFVLMLAIALVYRIRIVWMGKNSLFRWPLGLLFKRLGGIPIDRSSRHNVVEQAIEVFDKREKMIMVITPEGTRKKVKTWKTGFYYIAKGANVPLVLGFADYKHKVTGFGPAIVLSGDIEADMRVIRDFYSGICGKYPEKTGDIQVAAKNDDG